MELPFIFFKTNLFMCEIEKLNNFFIDYDDTTDSIITTYCCKLARQQFSINVLKEKGLQFIIDQTYNNGKITELGYEGTCNLSCRLSNQPSEIYIHAIHKCNFDCYNCSSGHAYNLINKNSHNLDKCKSVFFEIIEYIKKLEYKTSIIIDGSGDIFSYYSELTEYLKTLKNSNLKQVIFETNTSLLNGSKILELKKISQETNVKYIFKVSIDGITKETHEAVRPKSSFKRTLIMTQAISENFETVINFTIKRPNVYDTLTCKSFFNTLFPNAKVFIEYDFFDTKNLSEKLNDSDLFFSGKIYPSPNEIKNKCEFSSTANISYNFKNDSFDIQPCCFIDLITLSHDDFFKLSINELNYRRPENRNQIKCEYPCVFKKIDYIVLNILHSCNISCYNCIAEASNHIIYNAKKRLFEVINKIINEKYFLKGLQIDGSGEIFLVYDELKEILQKIDSKYIQQIIFSTNATLLSEKRLLELKEISEKTKVEYIFDISLDGITKETYEATRVGANFDKVISNINILKKFFKFKMSFTYKKTNMSDDKNDVIKFFKNLGTFDIHIRPDVYDKEVRSLFNTLYEEERIL